jgi:pyridinium-3,5-biscarboxylic acid mononucleotide sulfurtransferase
VLLPSLSSLPQDPKLQALGACIQAMGSVLVCYSGGVDSAFVLAVAHRVLGPQAIGMTAVSPSLAPEEREGALAVAKQIGARHELVDSQEIEDENYAKNGSDRCFYCKSELYRIAAIKQAEWRTAFVLNGTNTDDLGDHRPGLEAAKQASARSPLVECGFNKAEVRRCAELMGLPVWDKPAAACLSSRLPYGTRVTRERLSRIASLEEALHRLGLRQVRVRLHPIDGAKPSAAETSNAAPQPEADLAMARVEVAQDELPSAFAQRESIVAEGKRAGFLFVTLDLAGYRMGSHNEVLKGRSLRIVQ